MGVVLQFWFWLTPIVYPRDIVPERFVWIQDINPLSWLMRSYQDIFLLGEWPHWSDGWLMFGLAAGSILLGYISFKRLNREMVDEL
jgi:lipopolysaccharide transport system permease protein